MTPFLFDVQYLTQVVPTCLAIGVKCSIPHNEKKKEF